MRIRSRLLLLVLAVLVPSLLGAALALAYVYREEQKFNHARVQETARALALALDRDMQRRAAMLTTLAASPSLQRGEYDRFHGYAVTMARETDSAIILSDLEGRQLVNSRLPRGASLPRMLPAERENRARFGNEATIVSDVYVPPAGLGPHSFAIQVPVRRDGKVVAFLTMGSYASQLQRLLDQQRLPDGWLASVIDRNNVVAARNMDPGKFVGQPVRPELGAKLAAQDEGFHDGMTLAGVASTAFFSRAPESRWVFLVAVPSSALHGAGARATLAMAGVSLLLLALGFVLALIAARRVTRTVEALRAGAERLGRSEPVRAPSSGIVELDAVGAAMADASARLQGSTAELERRVAQALAAFEQSQRALVQAQKLDALGRLTGGIAHDFNNVLQTLTTGLQALRYASPQADRELIERCQRAVARGAELARQLMAFGRVQEVRAQTIDTAARVAEAQPLLAGALPSTLRLELDLPADLWPVTVDPAQLEPSLLNLVINARDAMPGGGTITLRGRNEAHAAAGELAAGEYVALAVSDTGAGMNEEVLARALDPFYTTKEVGKGTGMGLPQAYGFARQNGGTLELASRPGAGTTATLLLPRARRGVTRAAATATEEAPPAGSGRVLLVEDDDTVRDTMRRALSDAGFEVQAASSADEASSLIEAGERFDAVLTDVVMPGTMNGADLAAWLRQHHPRMGVVLVTGYSERSVQLPGVRSLAKPFDTRQVVQALNETLRAA